MKTSGAHLIAIAIAIAFAVVTIASAVAKPVKLSAEARSAINSVHSAIKEAKERCGRQDGTTPSKRLICLGWLDQAGRDKFQSLDLSSLLPGQPQAVSAAVWDEISQQDRLNQAELLTLIPKTGWFTTAAYGSAASSAAWNIVQHATNNLPLMHDALERISQKTASVNGDEYGKLVDRVRMLEGKPQIYGSQFKCVDHRWALYQIETPGSVDERRLSIGMTETERQVQDRLGSYPPCYFK